MRPINEAGLALVKYFEGFRSYPYPDSRGIRTIGYGHTKGVTAYSTPITPEEAEELLKSDLENAEALVLEQITVGLNANQYAALASLVFNAGAEPLRKTLGQLLNQGEYQRAAEEFGRWVYAGGVEQPGLVRRRAAEKALFLKPEH